MPTPGPDQLAREGLRLTQFLVEPACTPSRAALMTGRIRSGTGCHWSVPGTPFTLPADAYTMGQLFKDAGYATAIFGKWHLGIEPQSLPRAHGFDTFYGIPPDTSWDDAATSRRSLRHTHRRHPREGPERRVRGSIEQTGNGPLKNVKPFTPEVRAEIDNDC